MLSDLVRGLVGFYCLILAVFSNHLWFLPLLLLIGYMYVRDNREWYYIPPRPEQKEIIRDSIGHPLYVSYKPAESRRFGFRKRQ